MRDRAARVIENSRVKLFFVPKMIMDRRHIGFRLVANFADRGSAETMLGEHFASGIQESLAGLECFISAFQY